MGLEQWGLFLELCDPISIISKSSFQNKTDKSFQCFNLSLYFFNLLGSSDQGRQKLNVIGPKSHEHSV